MKPVAMIALAGNLLLESLPGPLAEFGPVMNMGLAGVILAIWWMERKERRERQVEDDKRYGELLQQLINTLKEQK